MDRLQIFGATPSPYTQKMLSLLRYRRIPYDIHWGETKTRLESLNIELPKPILLPVILFEDDDQKLVAMTDSTPMLRKIENTYAQRKVIPDDPALAFINYLLEDFGDEWITKYMFHYRWHFKDDAEKAGTILPLVEFQNPLSVEDHNQIKEFIIMPQTIKPMGLIHKPGTGPNNRFDFKNKGNNKANEEAAGVGIVTKQNATKDVPVGGEYMNVKKLHLGKGKPKTMREEWEEFKENFADGKRKGKSRPGRVKRAGASCKGSVTSLRAKAKKSSGERAKMYHWCANMKSGRKKKK